MVEMEKLKSLKIIEYHFDREYLERYFKLILELYKGYNGVELYIQNMKRVLSESNPFFKNNKIWNYIAFDGLEVVGHISSIIDLKLFENNKIGMIGFFECINDSKVSKLLIKKALERLRSWGCNIVRAPINLSIWHNYRFTIVQNKKHIFYFEPLTKNYYPYFFLDGGFYEIENYYSAERIDFNTILDYAQENYLNLVKKGYKFRTGSTGSFHKDLISIYSLSKEVFKKSKNYVDISFEEFNYIYLDMEKEANLNFLNIISNPFGKDIGFCFSLENPLNPKIMILKTIGVLEEYQNNGIGAGLLYLQHKKAKDHGYDKFVYALISEDTKIKKLPYPGAKVIRNYKLYEKQI